MPKRPSGWNTSKAFVVDKNTGKYRVVTTAKAEALVSTGLYRWPTHEEAEHMRERGIPWTHR